MSSKVYTRIIQQNLEFIFFYFLFINSSLVSNIFLHILIHLNIYMCMVEPQNQKFQHKNLHLIWPENQCRIQKRSLAVPSTQGRNQCFLTGVPILFYWLHYPNRTSSRGMLFSIFFTVCLGGRLRYLRLSFFSSILDIRESAFYNEPKYMNENPFQVRFARPFVENFSPLFPICFEFCSI